MRKFWRIVIPVTAIAEAKKPIRTSINVYVRAESADEAAQEVADAIEHVIEERDSYPDSRP